MTFPDRVSLRRVADLNEHYLWSSRQGLQGSRDARISFNGRLTRGTPGHRERRTMHFTGKLVESLNPVIIATRVWKPFY